MISQYKKLLVWNKSMELVDIIYKLTKTFPSDEIFGITSQIRRSAISIPSNIAEGSERTGKKEFLNFLKIAKGSIAELETQLLISRNNNFSKDIELFDVCFENILEIRKMISGLYSKIEKENNSLNS